MIEATEPREESGEGQEKIGWDEYKQIVQDAINETPDDCPCGCCE